MSLELALKENTAAVQALIDVWTKLVAQGNAVTANVAAKTAAGESYGVTAAAYAGHSIGEYAAAVTAGDGVVRVSRETKGRGGKTATVVKGVALDAAALTALGKQLKALCGSGGTVKDGVIEVQGDHCDRIVEALKKLGHQVKRAGG